MSDRTEPPFDSVRAYICDYCRDHPGPNHVHADCWHLAMAADIIEARAENATTADPFGGSPGHG